MRENSNNLTQKPILDKKRYVTVQKDSKNRETREMEAKDRFLIIGIFLAIIMFLSPFITSLFDMFKGLSRWEKLIFLLILCSIIWLVILKVIKRMRFFKNIECGSVWKKEAKIVDFEYSESDDDSWYYVILSDWEKKYKVLYCSWAKIIGKTDLDLETDDFYEKNWISLDLQDRDTMKKQIDKKISDLELQRTNVSFFKKHKIDSEIEVLKHKKQDLEMYHLHSQGWDFYIWDTYKVLVDLEDANNYILESEYKW